MSALPADDIAAVFNTVIGELRAERYLGALSHLLAQARQHPSKRAVAKNPMMHQCSRHVKQRQNDEEIGENFMHFLQSAG